MEKQEKCWWKQGNLLLFYSLNSLVFFNEKYCFVASCGLAVLSFLTLLPSLVPEVFLAT